VNNNPKPDPDSYRDRNPKLLVIGGGAAGFFCAVNAAGLNPALEVKILEKTNKLLSKVRISGGGRCNVTHALFDITEMSKRYPRGQNFVKKTFHQFFTKDTIEWFEGRGVVLKTEEDGRMFPVTDSSETIVDCLFSEVNKYGVQVKMNTGVTAISRENERWKILTEKNETLLADFVCIATGGYPKASMFEWILSTGHHIEEPVPSLFTFNLPHHSITELMGVAVEKARVKIEGSKLSEDGPLLITHWGLSGPAILKLSAKGARVFKDMDYKFKVHINWMPGMSDQPLKDHLRSLRSSSPSKMIANLNFSGLPNRLWIFLLETSGIKTETRVADLTAKSENALIKNLIDYVVPVSGKTTFKEEFVTAGGIDLSEVDANTMMSRIHPNLFFAGEVLNVDGVTGGFNFQHAWTSGWIAAKSVSEISKQIKQVENS
jgi:predicted Rossmann fold flavoprotein